MPRPPVLDPIDWKAVHDAGKPFPAWLAAAESSEQREAMVELLKHQTIPPHAAAALKGLARPVHVIAIAEDWCGDVVRHVPVLEKLASETNALRVRYIAREDRPDVFARFLTNGGEAIPKFIFLNENFVECANWGPMPAACREAIARGKAAGDVRPARERVSALYAADPEKRTVVRELMDCIDIAAEPAAEPANG